MCLCGDGGGEQLGECGPSCVSFILWSIIVRHVSSDDSEWCFCCLEGECEEPAIDGPEVCDAGGDVRCCDNGDASVWLGVCGSVSTVEDGIAHDGVHVWGCEVGLWKD